MAGSGDPGARRRTHPKEMPLSSRSASRARIVVLGALTAFGPMSIDMYLPSLPTIERDLAADTAATQLTLSAFFIGLAAGQIFYGPLADRFGRKPPLYFGLALYAIASIGAALSASIGELVVCRLLQALGGCAGMVIARAMVRDLFDEQSSARVLSTLMLVMGVAPILAPLAGGWVLLALGWRAIFVVLACFGLACLVMAGVALPETLPRHADRPTLRSTLATYGGLLRHRQFLGYTLAGGFAGAGMLAYISGSPFVFIEVFGVSPQSFGWYFGANAFGLIAASQVNRHLLRHFPSGRILAWANAVNAVFAVALVVVAWSGAGGLAGLLVPLFGFVATLGFIFANAAAGAMAPFGTRAGSAAALMGTVQFAIAAVAGAMVGRCHDGTAVPMAVVICGCGLAAFVSRQVLLGRPAAA